MEALIDYVRIALCAGATDDERRRAIFACHTLAEGFRRVGVSPDRHAGNPPRNEGAIIPIEGAIIPIEAEPGGPLGANPFAGMTADQILELAIAKLRGAVGEPPAPPVGQPFRLTLVPVPRAP